MKKKIQLRVLWLASLMVLGQGAWMATEAATSHVWAASPSPGAPYDAWSNAAHDIQTALSYAASHAGYEAICVTDGTYVLSGQLVVTNSLTIRSVNGAGVTMIDGGWPGITSRCFYVANTGAVVDGFTITNGATTGYGGGVYIAYNGTVRNCVITGCRNTGGWGGGAGCFRGGLIHNSTIIGNFATNTSDRSGGGAYCQEGGVISNCCIVSNQAGSGGGILLYSGGLLVNCRVYANSAGTAGGIYAHYGGIVSGCWVSNNTTPYLGSGAGIWCDTGGCVTNSLISNNQGTFGGGVRLDGNGASLVRSDIINNRAGNSGGGIYAQSGAAVLFCRVGSNIVSSYDGGGIWLGNTGLARNCLFFGNHANRDGGGVHFGGNSSIVDSCTIAGNQAFGQGGGIYAGISGAVTNTIIWFNNATNAADLGTNTGVAAYSCAPGLTSGVGNLAANPAFASPGSGYGTNLAAGDYRLQNNSACIDAGINEAWMTNAFDLDGQPRIRGFYKTRQVDMGAYEGLQKGVMVICF